MKSAKTKLRAVVKAYQKISPQDYIDVISVIAAKRALPKKKFGLIEGSEMTRALFEIPEDLSSMIVGSLDIDELMWFKSGIKGNPNQGGRWFAKTFPEFCLIDIKEI